MINLTYFCKLIQSVKMAFGSFLSIREVKTPLNPAATLKETAVAQSTKLPANNPLGFGNLMR